MLETHLMIYYHGTRASKVLRVPLELVEVHVSTKCWFGHPRL